MDLSLPLVTALPLGLYLALHALHDRVQAHWPATIFAAFALAAAAAVEARPRGWRPRTLATGQRTQEFLIRLSAPLNN
jgi:hypothetical protein